MKFYDKPFNHDLYKECDQPGKLKVIELIRKYNIDTNVFEVIETPEDPKPDLKGDNFWHEVGVGKYQWKNYNHLPNFLTIVHRKRKYFIFNPIFWIVSGDFKAAVWIHMDDLYHSDVKVVVRRSIKTRAGYEKWFTIPKKFYEGRVLI